jgi:hypothetical protein
MKADPLLVKILSSYLVLRVGRLHYPSTVDVPERRPYPLHLGFYYALEALPMHMPKTVRPFLVMTTGFPHMQDEIA